MEDAANLLFENEHQLGTKPKEIDVLIIKKKKEESVRKNIGRIFRKHNIVEYKSPEDYLSVDDFYKVYGYACFYKADAKAEDSIKIDDITTTFVCSSYPRKLIAHLKERQYCIQKVESGIYYIHGLGIPVQLIVTKELSEEENLWLKNLTNELSGPKAAEKLLSEYGNHKENNLYKSMMNIIVRANEEQFQEVKSMCEALEELMKDELEERENRGIERGMGIFIQDNLEENKSKEQIVAKLIKRFSLTEEAAEGYYNKYAVK